MGFYIVTAESPVNQFFSYILIFPPYKILLDAFSSWGKQLGKQYTVVIQYISPANFKYLYQK
ncbi:hypothetical protein DSBG_0034 [Desulfosporosinus sp. BG]|nr:hypothetical protein DSBG_0034 [Desulfosporosinus sp. BG]